MTTSKWQFPTSVSSPQLPIPSYWMKFKKINSLRSWQHNKKTPNAQHPLDRHKPLLFRCKREFHIPLTHSKTSQHLPGVPSPRETIWGTEPASHMGKPQRPVGHSHLKPKSSKEKPVNKGSNVQGERISKRKKSEHKLQLSRSCLRIIFY